MVIIQLTEQEFQEAITKAVLSALASQKASPADELFSRQEAAAYLKVTYPTLNNWEKKGYIKAVRLGSRVFFKKSELLNNKANGN